MNVHFTDVASEQLDGIYAYIAKDSPHYARRVIDQIVRKANNTAIMPQAAAIVPEYSRPDIREVFAYRSFIAYCLTGSTFSRSCMERNRCLSILTAWIDWRRQIRASYDSQ